MRRDGSEERICWNRGVWDNEVAGMLCISSKDYIPMYMASEHVHSRESESKYPQSAPVLPLSNHFSHPMHHVQHPQTRLHIVNRLIQIRSRLLTAQQRPLLLGQPPSDLTDARIQSCDFVPQVICIRFDREQRRHGRYEILVIVATYAFDFGILRVDERL